MCYELDARPPSVPLALVAGSALDAGEQLLTAADGTRLRAYAARPSVPTGAGIVILPDVRGLHPFYEELALRFAEAGVDAVAIDYFARTAGTAARGADFEFGWHLAQVEPATLDLDVAAGVAFLRDLPNGPTRVYTVGFCFGGRLSWLQAAAGLRLAGVIGFYGVPVGSNRLGLPEPVAEANRFRGRVLALFGGADEGIPEASREAFERALSDADLEHRVKVYPGAPHSFFDRHADEFTAESADAWREVLEFMRPTAAES